MKIIVLGGFLGSGKTTVLLQLASYLVKANQGASKNPVVILENEISAAGIDSRLLTGNSFNVKNIFSGCICCSGAAQLIDSAKKIRLEYDPAWLLIEATGMAHSDSILEELQNYGFPDAAILALADAKRWARFSKAMPEFINSQMNEARVILVSKKDLVSACDLAQVIKSLGEINPQASILGLNALEEQPDSFWQEVIAGLNK